MLANNEENNDFFECIEEQRINNNIEQFDMISNFSCGDKIFGEDPDLDAFLKYNAYNHDEEALGNTYLIIDKELNEIIAYYTLRCNSFHIKDSINGTMEAIPTIEIARLAVDKEHQNQSWGTAILGYFICDKIKKIANMAAVKCIMVFVDGDDERAIHFYKKFGFELCGDEIQNYISDSFNNDCGCKLMTVALNDVTNIGV